MPEEFNVKNPSSAEKFPNACLPLSPLLEAPAYLVLPVKGGSLLKHFKLQGPNFTFVLLDSKHT